MDSYVNINDFFKNKKILKKGATLITKADKMLGSIKYHIAISDKEHAQIKKYCLYNFYQPLTSGNLNIISDKICLGSDDWINGISNKEFFTIKFEPYCLKCVSIHNVEKNIKLSNGFYQKITSISGCSRKNIESFDINRYTEKKLLIGRSNESNLVGKYLIIIFRSDCVGGNIIVEKDGTKEFINTEFNEKDDENEVQYLLIENNCNVLLTDVKSGGKIIMIVNLFNNKQINSEIIYHQYKNNYFGLILSEEYDDFSVNLKGHDLKFYNMLEFQCENESKISYQIYPAVRKLTYDYYLGDDITSDDIFLSHIINYENDGQLELPNYIDFINLGCDLKCIKKKLTKESDVNLFEGTYFVHIAIVRIDE